MCTTFDDTSHILASKSILSTPMPVLRLLQTTQYRWVSSWRAVSPEFSIVCLLLLIKVFQKTYGMDNWAALAHGNVAVWLAEYLGAVVRWRRARQYCHLASRVPCRSDWLNMSLYKGQRHVEFKLPLTRGPWWPWIAHMSNVMWFVIPTSIFLFQSTWSNLVECYPRNISIKVSGNWPMQNCPDLGDHVWRRLSTNHHGLMESHGRSSKEHI